MISGWYSAFECFDTVLKISMAISVVVKEISSDLRLMKTRKRESIVCFSWILCMIKTAYFDQMLFMVNDSENIMNYCGFLRSE